MSRRSTASSRGYVGDVSAGSVYASASTSGTVRTVEGVRVPRPTGDPTGEGYAKQYAAYQQAGGSMTGIVAPTTPSTYNPRTDPLSSEYVGDVSVGSVAAPIRAAVPKPTATAGGYTYKGTVYPTKEIMQAVLRREAYERLPSGWVETEGELIKVGAGSYKTSISGQKVTSWELTEAKALKQFEYSTAWAGQKVKKGGGITVEYIKPQLYAGDISAGSLYHAAKYEGKVMSGSMIGLPSDGKYLNIKPERFAISTVKWVKSVREKASKWGIMGVSATGVASKYFISPQKTLIAGQLVMVTKGVQKAWEYEPKIMSTAIIPFVPGMPTISQFMGYGEAQGKIKASEYYTKMKESKIWYGKTYYGGMGVTLGSSAEIWVIGKMMVEHPVTTIFVTKGLKVVPRPYPTLAYLGGSAYKVVKSEHPLRAGAESLFILGSFYAVTNFPIKYTTQKFPVRGGVKLKGTIPVYAEGLGLGTPTKLGGIKPPEVIGYEKTFYRGLTFVFKSYGFGLIGVKERPSSLIYSKTKLPYISTKSFLTLGTPGFKESVGYFGEFKGMPDIVKYFPTGFGLQVYKKTFPFSTFTKEKMSIQLSIIRSLQAKESKFLQKKFVYKTRYLSEEQVRGTVGFSREKKGYLYGSFVSQAQVPTPKQISKYGFKYVDVERVAGDIDIQLERTSLYLPYNEERTQKATKELLKLLRGVPGAKVRISPSGPTLIEAKIGKEWVHAVDIHSLEGSELGGTTVFGFNIAQTPLKLERVKVMRPSEQVIRKGVSIMIPKEITGGEWVIGSEAHRIKDIGDFFSGAETLARSSRIPFVKSTSVTGKDVIAKLGKLEAYYPAGTVKGGGVRVLEIVGRDEFTRSTEWGLFGRGINLAVEFPKVSPGIMSNPPAFGVVSISPVRSFKLEKSFSPSVSKSVRTSLSISPSVSKSLGYGYGYGYSVSKSVSSSISPSPSVSVSPYSSPSVSPSISPSPSPSVSPSASPSISPPPPPPWIPKFGVGVFGFGGKGGLFRKPKFKPKYTPSLEAGFFGIRGKQPRTITGIETRPLPLLKKLRRRRK